MTIIRGLSGAVTPDAGDIRFGGAPLPTGSPRASEACGIATIYPEFNLVPGLTASQNIFFLGHEASVPGRGSGGLPGIHEEYFEEDPCSVSDSSDWA